MWRIPQGPHTDELCRELGSATHYIADGHHRVAASLEVWARSGRDSSRGVLCVAYPLDGLRLASIDRRVAGPVDTALVRGLLEASFDVRPAPDAQEALASGIAVNLDRRWYAARYSGERPPGSPGLDVSLLHDRVLDRLPAGHRRSSRPGTRSRPSSRRATRTAGPCSRCPRRSSRPSSRSPTRARWYRPRARSSPPSPARASSCASPAEGRIGAVSGLAQVYRRFAGAASPLYERVAVALSECDAALRAIEAAPARKRQPAVILAALHDLALAGSAPALAAAYAAADGDAAAAAAIDTLLSDTAAVVAVAARRPVRANETGRCAVLYPAVAEAARRAGADAVGLIDVGGSAGLNLTVDRVGITYDNGQTLGDPSSPVQMSASIVGARPVPERAMPEVVARIAVDRDPVDVTDPDAARWLCACLPPDPPERVASLEAELALAATDPPLRLRGDAVDVLPDALVRVPAAALPVVITTWALSRLPLEGRLRFLPRLDEAATDRPVAWVSVEGVGVAPAIPTFGDRRASGHSIIGLAVFAHSTLRADAVGRCWSRGRLLAWLAGER